MGEAGSQLSDLRSRDQGQNRPIEHRPRQKANPDDNEGIEDICKNLLEKEEGRRRWWSLAMLDSRDKKSKSRRPDEKRREGKRKFDTWRTI